FYAEKDMERWGLSRAQFDKIANEHTELRYFLTELLSEKLSSRGTTTEKRIGKYIVTDLIGYGSNSIVLKGRHADLNMPVAVKIIRHDWAMDPHFMKNYQEAAAQIAHLNHQNIVKVFDFEKRFRTLIITTELLEGETVASQLERWKTIPVPQATVFLTHICAGLVYAHQHNIIHGFLKPSNLFVSQNGDLKILDFGIGYPKEIRISDLSGAVAYMSPEQIEGRAADDRSDIYSLGITAYEMITGKTPFADDTTQAPADACSKRQVPDPAEHVQGLPEILRRFILKACAKEPEKRYQSATTAHNDLMVLAKALRLESEIHSIDSRKMTSLFLFYKEEHRLALKRLLEEFSSKTKELGINLKASDITDL
ncbi:MAG: serine/threonine-protein kinase, partial [Desulfobacterales bacterium]